MTMPLRLGYRKSRAGCLRCKQRRVKCDENKPCTACTRHRVPCSLVAKLGESHGSQHLDSRTTRPRSLNRNKGIHHTQPQSLVDPFPYFDNRPALAAADAQHRGTWVADLELMHHYTTVTCETLPRIEKLKRIWQIEVPKSGIEHPFVMHQILSVAALHLGYLYPECRQRYILHASRHQSEAVAGIRKLITNITPRNCEALFSASSLLIISAYATFPDPREWARLGLDPIPPITAEQLNLSASNNGGLIIAGSYVPKTTAQLHALTSKTPEAEMKTIILDVKRLLSSPETLAAEVASARDQAAAEIAGGKDVLVMTSRELIVGADETSSLDIGSTVAKALVDFLQGFDEKVRPRYVIAKGGITSSDMATKGLRFKKALIVGQASPGVPLWRCDEPTSKWSGVPYVVFPGNVGGEDALYEVTKRWRV